MQHNSQNPVKDQIDDTERFDTGLGSGLCTAITGQKSDGKDLKVWALEFSSSLAVDEQILQSLIRIIDQGNISLATKIIDTLLVLNPTSIHLQFLYGTALFKDGRDVEAINAYKTLLNQKNMDQNDKVISEIIYNTHNNLGLIFKKLGLLEDAKKTLEIAVGSHSQKAEAYNNLGTVYLEMADISGAQKSYLRAVKLEPNDPSYYWNLHSTSETVMTAKHILGLCIKKGPRYEQGVLTLAGLEALTGNTLHFNNLRDNGWENHPLVQSIEWVLALPNIPELHFNRWTLFDSMAGRVSKSRPFYEFGVWMGASFQYLARHFSKGYGFDTFEGLPEDWGNITKGSYSARGRIPKVLNGDFVVGKFTESLPAFFSIPRPVASIINYDADLYSSTLTALNHCHSVTDDATILIFDEFLVNKNWQSDEHAALIEFCQDKNLTYEVLAVSFFTKQVACRLVKK